LYPYLFMKIPAKGEKTYEKMSGPVVMDTGDWKGRKTGTDDVGAKVGELQERGLGLRDAEYI
jgi:hypothetical protein